MKTLSHCFKHVYLCLRMVILCFAALTARAQWVHISGPAGKPTDALVTSGAMVFAAIDSNGVWRSTDSGESWHQANTGLPLSGLFGLASSGSRLMAGTDRAIFLSTNNGESWDSVHATPGQFHLALGGSDPAFFVETVQEGLYRSTDNGRSWDQVSLHQGFFHFPFATLGANLFSGGQGFGSLRGVIYRSADNGGSWSVISSSGLATISVDALIVLGTNLFAGTYGTGIFLSRDSGATWRPVNVGLTVSRGFTFAAHGTNLFAGTDSGGVYLSTDSGESWHQENAGLTDLGIWHLAISGSNLIAGTATGLWRRPFSEMITSVQRSSADSPVMFALQQNYPNPFNPSTTIGYNLPHRSHVTLSIFNTLGQKVAVLINGEVDAGSHEVQFSAANLASGVYFYRLQAGGFMETKKLLLTR